VSLSFVVRVEAQHTCALIAYLSDVHLLTSTTMNHALQCC
jgi:acyl-CoA thioesterase